MTTAFVLVALGGVLVWALVLQSRAAGRAGERVAAQEDNLDRIAEANAARDRVRVDPDERQRLRDKYRGQ